MNSLDISKLGTRETNDALQHAQNQNGSIWKIINPNGAHAIAAGLTEHINVEIEGHVGYYCGGMNQNANILINGNAGTGLAENMMSGEVRLNGNASQSVGASGHGGLLVIEFNASSRCGISMKGIEIVVKGDVGHMSAFMAQAGHLVICGNADSHLGASIYEAVIYLQGKTDQLGADCIEKEMTTKHIENLNKLLNQAEVNANPKNFRRYGSARKLYNFQIDNVELY